MVEPEMKTREPDACQKDENELLEDADQEHDADTGPGRRGKSMVECLCPGCGKFHSMKIYWSGRGVCRKFCQTCRDRESPLDDDSR
jgi:hypothetical protein